MSIRANIAESALADDQKLTGFRKCPHYVAVVLVCVTFPLIWVGGLVTTYDAGMAVPDWPSTYGYNMFLYPIATWLTGPWDLFIEHGHRLLGSLAGILTIGLNLAIWKFDGRRWMRWMGFLALLLVVSQGVLGGMRVRLNSTDLARAHGCTGPLFFASSVAIAVMTSRYWFGSAIHPGTKSDNPLAKSWVIGGWGFVLLAYAQLVLGAHLRHPGLQWSPSQFRGVVLFHVLAAVALIIKSVGIALRSRKLPSQLGRPAMFLLVLVLGQVVLGVATWRAKYGWPSFIPMIAETSADRPVEIAVHNAIVGGTVQAESMSQAITVTAHVALGSLILAVGVIYATRLSRHFALVRGRRQKVSGNSSNASSLLNQQISAVAGGLST